MNKFLFFRKYIFTFLLINYFTIYVLGDERNCLNYPFPEGIYYKIKKGNKKQLIYTKSVAIKSQNIRKIEFVKKKNNLYAITSLSKNIKLYFPNIEEKEIGIYNLYSCFNSKGVYKVSYAQRYVDLRSINIFQKVKKFFGKPFLNE